MKRKIALNGLGLTCAAIGGVLLVSLFEMARHDPTDLDGVAAVCAFCGFLAFLAFDAGFNCFRLALRKPSRSSVRVLEILVGCTLGLPSLFVLSGVPGKSGVQYGTRVLLGACLGAALGCLLAHQRLRPAKP